MSETVTNTTKDPTLQFTELKLGNKTYQLIFDFDAIAQAERITGMPLLFWVDLNSVTVERTRAMLYASALKAHPGVTLEEFTPFLRLKYAQRIQEALVKAWRDSTPEEELENPPMPEPAPANAA